MDLFQDIAIEYIENQADLNSVVATIQKQETIPMDMEVDNMHHYQSSISLIQILIGKTCYLVDAFSDLDLEMLLHTLQSKELLMHGCDFDLRMLFNTYGFTPSTIFDTMIAARLTGRKSFGLGALVQEYFGVTLDKQYQKEDWSKRPLSTEMIEYAAYDTFFLIGLKEKLLQELQAVNRISWNQQSCDALIQATQIKKEEDEETIWRIKGSHKLPPRQLHALRALWTWRENQARIQDKHPQKIWHNISMLNTTKHIPSGKDQTIDWEKIPFKLTKELKQECSKYLQEAMEKPIDTWPHRLKKKSPRILPNPQIVEQLKTSRDKIAEDLGLPEHMIATRENILHTVLNPPANEIEFHQLPNLMPWQRELLLKPWLKTLQNS
jgi:ribonuclease D